MIMPELVRYAVTVIRRHSILGPHLCNLCRYAKYVTLSATSLCCKNVSISSNKIHDELGKNA